MSGASGDREVAVVVGASGAFGTVIADRLVAADLDVIAVARTEAALAELAATHPGRVEACAADLTDDAAQAVVAEAVGERVVRMVVHGPGVAVAGGIADAPVEALIGAVDIKVGGLLRLVRATVDRMAEHSRIVAIAGHYGLEPSPYAASAGIANAAVFSAVRQLSMVYGERGITAHTLAPGPADTERLRRVAADRAERDGITVDEVLDDMRAESSIRALSTPEQVAWAVAMLLAPEASAMTGSTVMLESGRRRGLP